MEIIIEWMVFKIVQLHILIFSYPEQLQKSSRWSVGPLVRWYVGPSVGPSESFVKSDL